MQRKLNLSSTIGILAIILMLVFPFVAKAGTVNYPVYNSTGTKYFNHSFSHNANSIPSCTSSPAQFTNNMRVSLGAVTNSSIRVNNHRINPSISSGTLYMGRATVFSTVQYTNNSLYGVQLTHNSSRTVTWNRTMPINSSTNNVVVSQHLFPSSYSGSDYCQVTDNFIFTHSSFFNSLDSDESILSKLSINSTEAKKLEDEIKLLGFDKVAEFTEEMAYTKAFVLDDKLLDISIHNKPIEILDVTDRWNHGDVKVYTTKNIEGVNVYTLEIIDNDQYIYLTSNTELEDLLTLLN